jgi:hypothetical protein
MKLFIMQAPSSSYSVLSPKSKYIEKNIRLVNTDDERPDVLSALD